MNKYISLLNANKIAKLDPFQLSRLSAYRNFELSFIYQSILTGYAESLIIGMPDFKEKRENVFNGNVITQQFDKGNKIYAFNTLFATNPPENKFKQGDVYLATTKYALSSQLEQLTEIWKELENAHKAKIPKETRQVVEFKGSTSVLCISESKEHHRYATFTITKQEICKPASNHTITLFLS